MASESNSLSVACHCGALSLSVLSREQKQNTPSPRTGLTLCHCAQCRHVTGALCTSHIPIRDPDFAILEASSSLYETHDGTKWYFCSTCGCHVLRQSAGGPGSIVHHDSVGWEVATGVVNGSTEGKVTEDGMGNEDWKFTRHAAVKETRDGGLSIWLPGLDSVPPDTSTTSDSDPSSSDVPTDSKQEDASTLTAQCHCNKVHLRISRPSASSRLPTSNFPDLMIPYHTGDFKIKNPEDEKWWIRGTRFLAGTCACRSCRLTLGFEIQSWAFIPRSDISFVVSPEDGGGEATTTIPVDFEELHSRDLLREYESSPGVIREFCGRCGATVFWHDKWRPELLDVSVGLLRSSGGGVRAEEWLFWWRERVSFAEDAGLGREGWLAERAKWLIGRLGGGLKEDARAR